MRRALIATVPLVAPVRMVSIRIITAGRSTSAGRALPKPRADVPEGVLMYVVTATLASAAGTIVSYTGTRAAE
jgi:hypothetical protein